MTQGANLNTISYHLSGLRPAAPLFICEMATSPAMFRAELNEVLNDCEVPNRGLALEVGVSFVSYLLT